MKLIVRALIALSLLVSVTITSYAQKAEDIIQKHLAAIGGEDAWKKLNTLRMEGGMKANGVDVSVVTLYPSLISKFKVTTLDDGRLRYSRYEH